MVLETDDEMQCLVSGCNFLNRAVAHEAFTFENGAPLAGCSRAAPARASPGAPLACLPAQPCCAARAARSAAPAPDPSAATPAPPGSPTFVPANADSELFPYLLVNIGSGVSILKVDGPDSYQRVSGSSLGARPRGRRLRSGARRAAVLLRCAAGPAGGRRPGGGGSCRVRAHRPARLPLQAAAPSGACAGCSRASRTLTRSWR